MLHIANKTRGRIPKVSFREMKNEALGQGYELSLVFVGKKLSKSINNKYRGKDNSTNILSFPYSKNEGEILLDLDTIRQESKILNYDLKQYLGYLFIHGLIHLKGFDHGSRMEKEERKIREKFKIIF